MRFHEGTLAVVKFISSARIATGSYDCTIAVWNWEDSEKPSVSLQGRKDETVDLSLNKDGTKIISVYHNRALKVWNGKGGPAIATFPPDVETL